MGEREFEITYSILLDGVEIGFGAATASDIDSCAYDIGTALQRREWETIGDMPDPTEVEHG